MADYSEFPTTPTAWQERQARDWETVTPLATEDPGRRAGAVDLGALIPGLFFIVLAIIADDRRGPAVRLLADGGLVWLVLIGAGVALLVSELRRARRRRADRRQGAETRARGATAPRALRVPRRRNRGDPRGASCRRAPRSCSLLAGAPALAGCAERGAGSAARRRHRRVGAGRGRRRTARPLPLPAGAAATLTVAGGRARAAASFCNHYSGTYRLDGDALVVRRPRRHRDGLRARRDGRRERLPGRARRRRTPRRSTAPTCVLTGDGVELRFTPVPPVPDSAARRAPAGCWRPSSTARPRPRRSASRPSCCSSPTARVDGVHRLPAIDRHVAASRTARW